MKRLLLLIVISLMGCMQPDSPAASSSDPQGSGIIDDNLRAGATSSTNWPGEDAGSTPVFMHGSSDSDLTFFFIDSLKQPVKRNGHITLYDGGMIPAIEDLPKQSIFFSSTDSLKIPHSYFLNLAKDGNDTINFSIGMESDSLRGMILGFAYSKAQKTFLKSPFSEISTNSPKITIPKYGIQGVADSLLLRSGTSVPGKNEWCFYIPGSPYFWRVGVDSNITLGSLPFGVYPFRLLKISSAENGSNQNRLEAYEVKLVPKIADGPNQGKSKYLLELGDKIISTDVNTSLLIRAN